MNYARATAKTKAVARVNVQREIRIPNLESWHVNPPPFQPRCRHCGSKVTARDSKCSTCWRPL